MPDTNMRTPESAAGGRVRWPELRSQLEERRFRPLLDECWIVVEHDDVRSHAGFFLGDCAPIVSNMLTATEGWGPQYPLGTSTSAKKTACVAKRDRGFESFFLQREVYCELTFGGPAHHPGQAVACACSVAVSVA